MNRLRSWTAHPLQSLAVITSNSYDDDQRFTNTALTLLSKQHALDMGIEEAIYETLPTPDVRGSFLSGLNLRLGAEYHSNIVTDSLVQSIEHIFGEPLREIVASESDRAFPRIDWRRIRAPRNNGIEQRSWSEKKIKGAHGKQRARFFSDGDQSGVLGSSHVRNLDWQMVEAVKQVEHLSLDGMSPVACQRNTYQPPVHS